MTRVLAALSLAAATVALPLRASAAGPWSFHQGPRGRRAIADGRAETPGGVVAAVLRVQCRPKEKGSLCVSLKVEEASRIAAFDFAAFESEKGAATQQTLFHARAGNGVALDAAIGGHWAADPEGSFAFELCARNRGPSDAARLAQAIASGVGEIELAVRHPAGGGEIRARFPSDAEDRVVDDVLDGCWRPAARESH